jgi:hypothetical protein
MSPRKHDRTKPYKLEIVDGAITISLSYDPTKLALLLARLSIFDELRGQLRRRKPRQSLELWETAPDVNFDGLHDRIYMEYELVWRDEEDHSESFPLRHWGKLAKKLGLRPTVERASRMRLAWNAEEFLRYVSPNKLVYVLKQFLFEALHAAGGELVTETKRRELEQLGSLIDKCGELQPADKFSPAGLKRWRKEDLQGDLLGKLQMINVRRTPTYESVAAEMQSFYRFTPMLTGETLRKAVKYHGIDWKWLKAKATSK